MPLEIQSKTILNKTKRRDPWFLDDYTVNPYLACSFNCLFCYIRGSKYGLHMDKKLAIKTNALELLDKQLGNRAKKGQYGFIVLSSATDPYLQLEEKTELTRGVLKIILKYRFPLHVITRSNLITRDLDLLRSIGEQAILPPDLMPKLLSGVYATFSFSTLDDKIGKIFEPGATKPSDRIRAVESVSAGKIPTGISMMPLYPYLTDTDFQIRSMLRSFKSVGAQYVFPAGLTLFGNGPTDSKTLMFNAIRTHYPELIEKYKLLYSHGFRPSREYTKALDLRLRQLAEEVGIRIGIV